MFTRKYLLSYFKQHIFPLLIIFMASWQAYSWHNLGAKVTACDITPKAIEIAGKNAEKMGLDIEFVVADMQTLIPILDGQFDIVFASYPVWVQDIFEACRTWNRVMKKGGRLFWYCADHPIKRCISEDGAGVHIIKNYNNPALQIGMTFLTARMWLKVSVGLSICRALKISGEYLTS